MNPFENLQLEEPPLALDPSELLAKGRRVVRRRWLVSAACGSALLVAGAVVAVPLLDDPAPRDVVMSPAELSHDNLQEAVEHAVGGPLVDVRIEDKPAPGRNLTYLVVATFKGAVLSVGLGKEPTVETPSCTGDKPGLEGTPCTSEVLPDGATLVIRELSSGHGRDSTAMLVRPGGTYLSLSVSNVALNPSQLRAAAIELGQRWHP